ncbi:MAG: four helix bundle protein [Bacteroidetes bacterium]|nr:four helix bundle protein [Bacteroidota bacterium]
MTIQSLRSYDEMLAWQEAMTLATEVYRCTRDYPLAEIASLTAETRRAAAMIPSSIAEGWAARSTAKECRARMQEARFALMQLETFLILGLRLDYLTHATMDIIWPLTQSTGTEIASVLKAV